MLMSKYNWVSFSKPHHMRSTVKSVFLLVIPHMAKSHLSATNITSDSYVNGPLSANKKHAYVSVPFNR